MAYVVTEACWECKFTDCVEVCPVDCFHEGPQMLYIDPETCTDCNLCVPACPVQAIFADKEVPKQWQHYTKMNAEEAPKYPVLTKNKDGPMTGVRNV